jgi:branched-chain amino acid transport system ATP-binding protein
MVAIGRALMANPSLLILEEPSLGLAAQTVNDVYSTLAQISREGRTVIVTEETLVVAAAFASEACLMSQGRITLAGPPQELLNTTSNQKSVVYS